MLALVAAALFAVAFILNAAEVATIDLFSPTSLVILGLVLVAVHVGGFGGRTRNRR